MSLHMCAAEQALFCKESENSPVKKSFWWDPNHAIVWEKTRDDCIDVSGHLCLKIHCFLSYDRDPIDESFLWSKNGFLNLRPLHVHVCTFVPQAFQVQRLQDNRKQMFHKITGPVTLLMECLTWKPIWQVKCSQIMWLFVVGTQEQKREISVCLPLQPS